MERTIRTIMSVDVLDKSQWHLAYLNGHHGYGLKTLIHDGSRWNAWSDTWASAAENEVWDIMELSFKIPTTNKGCIMTFADTIKEHRLRLGLTQAEAASLLGASKRAYEYWEEGREPLKVAQEGALERFRRIELKQR